MRTNNRRAKVQNEKTKRLLGMTSLQIIILAILSCCSFTFIGTFAGIVLYNPPLLANIQPSTPTSYSTILPPISRLSLTPSPISYTATPTLMPINTATPTLTSTVVNNTPTLTPTPSRAELNTKYPAIDPALLYSHPNDYKGIRFRVSGIIVAMEQFENSNRWLVQIAPDLHEPSGVIVSRHPVAIINFPYDQNLAINMAVTIYGHGDGYETGPLGVVPIVIMEHYYY